MSTTDSDIQVAQANYLAGLEQYRRGLPALTHYTFNQRTRGAGYHTIVVPFDVTFADEPVFSYGSALVSISGPGLLPVASAIVLRWVRSSRHAYLGAQVTLSVDLSYRPSYTTDGKQLDVHSVGSDAITAIPVVAHHLTFTGIGHLPTKAETATKLQQATNKPTGMGAH
jgi:hypothetical protein